MKDYTDKKLRFSTDNLTVKVTKRISSSSQNQVYLCENLSNPKQVYALKILTCRSEDKLSVNMISSEMNLKNKENIVQYIDFTTINNGIVMSCFILMEYCQNGNLGDILKRLSSEKKPFSESQIWSIASKIAKGLSSIHQLKYAHRNLIPENILICSNDVNLKICDFGSASDKFYDNLSNSMRSEIIFDQIKGNDHKYQAPELVDLYSNYPISEKVDIWSLGMIIYSLMFDFLPFSNEIKFITGKNLFLTDEMENAYSPKLIELLKLMVVDNPSKRASANDIIKYIQNNNSCIGKQKQIDSKKISFSLMQKMRELKEQLFKRHSTQFWVHEIINHSSNSTQKDKYLKLLVKKAWEKKNKIIKFYKSISDRHIYCFTITTLKTIYLLHHYIFLGPIECLNIKDFNLEEFLDLFKEIWNKRYSDSSLESQESLKNTELVKFILSYTDLLKAKIVFHKKYHNSIENNYAICTKIMNFNLLIDRNFIIDLIKLYMLFIEKFEQIPFKIKEIEGILDIICYLFNEEIISLFNLIFYVILGYKKIYYNTNDVNQLNIYASVFIEITIKTNDFLNKLQSQRDSFKTQKKLKSFIIDLNYLKSILDNPKIVIDNIFDNNDIRSLFLIKEIAGVKLNKNIGSLISQNLLDEYFSSPTQTAQIENKEQNNTNKNSSSYNSKTLNKMTRLNSVNGLISKGFNFTEDKFTNTKIDFDFKLNDTRNFRTNSTIVENYKMRSLSKQHDQKDLLNYNFCPKKNEVNDERKELNQELNAIFSPNNQLISNSSITNFNNKPQQQMNIFSPMNCKTPNFFNLINYNSNINGNNNNNYNSYNICFQSKKSSYNKNIWKVNNNSQLKIQSQNQNINNNPMGMSTISQNSYPIPLNQQNSNIIRLNKVMNSNPNNYQSFIENHISNTPTDVNKFNVLSTKNNNYNNCYNIQPNMLNPVEQLASVFIQGEFNRPYYQWLISSKDITLKGKPIGFGGSSEVYLGNYRGTEVAVKKLHLSLDSKNLKEFQREVASLMMLRHPNVVLFMGAIIEPDNICIVTEYCAGGALFDLLNKQKEINMSWKLRLQILRDIAIGMNFLHKSNPIIIHRDLKSLNILLTKKIEQPDEIPIVKISDFGLSKILSRWDSKRKMTGELGTCHWMAPEVMQGRDYSTKVDVFSFGIMIWEICTRSAPYEQMEQQRIIYYVTIDKGRPDKSLIPPHTPKPLIQLMERCWDHEPNNRPTFEEIIDVLKKIKA